MYSQQPASHLPYVANAAPALPYSRNPVMSSQDFMQPGNTGFATSAAGQQYAQTAAPTRPNMYDQQRSSISQGVADNRRDPLQAQSYGLDTAGYGRASSSGYDQPASSGPLAYGPNSARQPTENSGYAAAVPRGQPGSPGDYVPSTAAAGFGSSPSPTAADAKKAAYRYLSELFTLPACRSACQHPYTSSLCKHCITSVCCIQSFITVCVS